jgi:hypothetical protein
LFFLLAGVIASAQAQSFSEGFDNITQLPASGWVMQNNSVPPGTTGWFQGNPNTFPAQSGASNSYIAADFHNTSALGTIDNWLMSPPSLLTNGSVFRFWTRSVANSPFPDRLEVRLSTAGSSTNVNNFTTVLAVINPNLEVGGYPQQWTEFTITLSGLPPICGDIAVQGRIAFRYFVTNAGSQGDNSHYIGIDTVNYIVALPVGSISPYEAPLDYNCDGRTDYVVVRKTDGVSGGQATWFINNGTTYRQRLLGISTDFFLGGDFDGDDRADITVYRPGAASTSYFYSLSSLTGTLVARQLGTDGDDPTVIGDYDGDDRDDFAVYRAGASAGQQSFWYYLGSATPNGGVTVVQWGQNGDFPAPGDYDGDSKNDFCVQRGDGSGGSGAQGVFLLNKSNGGTEAVVWGLASDLIVPGDYDGDLKTDFAVARSQNGQIIWSVLGRNANNIIHYGQPWGLSQTDFPTPGDYDGDGKTDIAVWRPNADPQQNFFYIRQSSNGSLRAFEWGEQGDYPVANFNSH